MGPRKRKLDEKRCRKFDEQFFFLSRLYNPMQIKNLSGFDSDTPWLQYINRILSKDIVQVKKKIPSLQKIQLKNRWSRPQEASKDKCRAGQFDENLYFYAYFKVGSIAQR